MGTRRVQVRPSQLQRHPPPVLRTSKCVKYTMFFKNMLFFLFGVLLIVVGVVALREKNKLHGEFDNLFLDPAAVLLAIGAVTFVISFCGALGALRENKCLLRLFYVSILIILGLEMALGGAVYGYREKIRSNVDDVFQSMVLGYHEDSDLQAVIDYVQSEVKCCGSRGVHDWENDPYFNCTNKALASACSVPFSCCRKDTINSMCGYGVLRLTEDKQEQKVYTTGCLAALEDWLMSHLVYAGIVCGCVVVLQLVAVALARRLITEIDDIIKWRDSHI